MPTHTVPTGRTLGAFWRGWRAVPGDGGAGRCDPDLLALTDTRFTSVSDTRERLAALESTLYERGDGRAAFLTVYARVTREVEAGIADGRFADPDWVARYLVAFADHYRAAFHGFERGRPETVPDAWQLAFDRALSVETLVVQDVLLGVNAHVNYDLALALDDVGIGTAAERRRRRADHRAVNGVLAGLVDVEQELLAERYAAGLADVDAALGRVDEVLSMLTLRQGRRNAWRGAVALAASPDPRLRRGVLWLLNTVSLGTGYTVLSPAASGRLLARLRRVENGG